VSGVIGRLVSAPARRIVVVCVGAGLALTAGLVWIGTAQESSDKPAPAAATGHWAGTWGASPQPAAPASAAGPGDVSATGFHHQTVRNIVFTSAAGSHVRVRLSNAYSDRPLKIGRVDVAVQASGARLESGTDRVLTFGGKRTITIPPGADAVSDAATMGVPALTDIAVSIYLPHRTGPATYHSLAEQTNYISGAGNFAGQVSGAAFTTVSRSLYYLDSVEVLTPGVARSAVVAFGDSITDGYGSQADANGRWPNELARRLSAGKTSEQLGVLDEGISGNRVLNDSPCFGQAALSRLDRDVIGQAGVRDVILLEGINDIGFSQTPNTGCSVPNANVSAADIVKGYEQIIVRAHAAGIKIFGGTLTPFKDAAYWSVAAERKRETVNGWIRHSGEFDGVVDFATATADPRQPQMFNPAFDSGDHLHPNAAGYRAMANAINLGMLR
jgi:lysophospholipase L1-like esterase